MTNNVNEFGSQADLLKVIRAFQNEVYAKLNVMRIGIIDEVLENNEVRCSITNKMLIKTNDDGTCVWQDYPPIYARVWYMGTAEENYSYPIIANNPCLLLFNDREMDSFFSTGEVSTLSSLRTHSLNDAICIPLFRPESNPQQAQISSNVITISASTINLVGDVVINGVKYVEHTHSGVQSGGGNSGGVVV